MDGGVAVTQVDGLRRLMRFVTQNGFEHHAATVRGHHAAVVSAAVTRYLGWPIYHCGAEPQAQLSDPARR